MYCCLCLYDGSQLNSGLVSSVQKISESVVDFSLTCPVLYTGFGNISPHTEGGKIFCIVYALLGIPLFGFLLAGVGDQLGTIFGKGIARVEKMFVVSKLCLYVLYCVLPPYSFR